MVKKLYDDAYIFKYIVDKEYSSEIADLNRQIEAIYSIKKDGYIKKSKTVRLLWLCVCFVKKYEAMRETETIKTQTLNKLKEFIIIDRNCLEYKNIWEALIVQLEPSYSTGFLNNFEKSYCKCGKHTLFDNKCSDCFIKATMCKN